MNLHEKHVSWADLPTEWINFDTSILKKIEMVVAVAISDALPLLERCRKRASFVSPQMCVLFITASERPASATAVGCFACNGSGALGETNLHLWLHIMDNDVNPYLPSPARSLSLSLTHPLTLRGGALCESQRSHENSLSRAPEHNIGRFRLKWSQA